MRDNRVVNLDRPGASREWMIEEVRAEAENWSAEEARAQIRLGNPPSELALDNNKAIHLTSNQLSQLSRQGSAIKWPNYKQTWLMQDVQLLIDALRWAWERIKEMTRVDSGRALSTYYFVLKNYVTKRTQRAETIDQAVYIIESWGDARTSAGIYGPTTPYRRKLIFNPRTGGRWENVTPAKGLSRLALLRDRDKTQVTAYARRRGIRYRVRVAQAMQKTIAKRLMSQFGGQRSGGIRAGYAFTKSRTALPVNGKWKPTRNQFIPVLWMHLRIGS